MHINPTDLVRDTSRPFLHTAPESTRPVGLGISRPNDSKAGRQQQDPWGEIKGEIPVILQETRSCGNMSPLAEKPDFP